jgi:hypothetical protein
MESHVAGTFACEDTMLEWLTEEEAELWPTCPHCETPLSLVAPLAALHV